MKVLIVEDEYLGLEKLKEQLENVSKEIIVVGTSDSITETVYWLKNNPTPDLIFMDIELNDGQCFEIFKQVKILSPIIFTTSYDEFALQAFKVNSIDYLLKPIKDSDLKQALEKFESLKNLYSGNDFNIDNLILQLQKKNKTFRNRFLVKQSQKLITIETSEIAYFYVEDRVTFFKTWNNLRYIADYTLDELMEMLNPESFRKINRSTLIHVNSIKEIQPHFNGKLKLKLKPEKEYCQS